MRPRTDLPDATGSPAASGRRARYLSPFVLVAVLATAAGLGTGAAYAYWSTSAGGSASAVTDAPSPVTVLTATGTVSTTLVPGGTAELLVALDNPNSYPVTITDLAQGGPAVSVGGACAATGVSIVGRSGLAVTVASGSDVVVRFPAGAAMAVDTDNACQGASFQIPVRVTVRR